LPERGIVELRDLTRRRKKLLGNLGAEKNRIQKILEMANVKIGNVVSDVFGVSGQEIVGACLQGHLDGGGRTLRAKDNDGQGKRARQLANRRISHRCKCGNRDNNHHTGWQRQGEQRCDVRRLIPLPSFRLDRGGKAGARAAGVHDGRMWALDGLGLVEALFDLEEAALEVELVLTRPQLEDHVEPLGGLRLLRRDDLPDAVDEDLRTPPGTESSPAARRSWPRRRPA